MSGNINAQSDSVIAILVAQCQDLEKLLVLAKQETAALRVNDFDQLLGIVKERASLSSRLEVYHKQLAELRGVMTQYEKVPSPIEAKTQELVSALQSQYAQSQPLLLAAREKLFKDKQQLEHTRRGVNSYSQAFNPTSIAYDRHL
jgi:hypothetical protein